jgi:hypothetical protein
VARKLYATGLRLGTETSMLTTQLLRKAEERFMASSAENGIVNELSSSTGTLSSQP